MNKYEITFKEKKKYKPATRTVTVQIPNGRVSPVVIFRQEFGSEKKVEVLDVKVVKDKKKK